MFFYKKLTDGVIESMKQNDFYLKVEREQKRKENIVSALKKILESIESRPDSKAVKKDRLSQRIEKVLKRR